ncbi:TatD family hydrolase [Candidatus Woesearchaeota archaeon]|nr:TatD family hydrolase [Candidatus Woesearchaeota archaeon]
MRYVDVHAHYDLGDFDNDIHEVLDSCAKNGIKAIIENGVHPKSNRKILGHAEKFSIIKPALGYYPVHVVEDGIDLVEDEIDFMKKNKDKFVAIGEVGMDFKVGDDNPFGDKHKLVQREAFEKFIVLSEKIKKPLIIHSRKAELEVIEMLESSKLKNPLMHCFMGKKKLMQRIADNGWNLSISPIVEKLQQLQEMVAYTSITQLLTETDAPYLAPVPGERNDSRNVTLAVKKIAEIKGLEEEEVANNIFMNYQKLFL